MQYDGDENKTDVCFALERHSKEVEFYDTTSLEVWYMKEAKFELECFYYCSDGGQVPQAGKVNETDVSHLVRNT